MKNRIISLILVLVLVFTLLPVYAIADANAETEPKVDEDMQLEQSPDIQTLVEQIKKLLNGGQDSEQLKARLKELLKDLDSEDFQAMLEKFSDGELKKLLENLDIEQLKEIIKGLLDKNGDIEDILRNLNKDKLLELFKQFIGDNETLKKLLEKLDSDQIADILKKLLEGGFDINGLLKNLDAYTFLKFIAGLMGSELDVTGPNDVTVKEGESATFKVKVNTAGTYKYLWLEPDAVKSIDFGGIDLSGNKLEIALKLLAALKKVSLSTTDTLTIAKAAASDNGRAFACMIYNIDLKSPTMYITNEAKLTVAAHEHTKVIDTPAVAATCTKDGCTEGSHCSECGEVLSKSEVIPATGHNYVHKVCANCGDEIPFPFTDVKKTDWCYNDVKYVWQYDIMFGVSDTKFGPRTYMTRAMFVTVLYRLEGSPSVEGMQIPAFTDIGAKWCYDAIIWAYNTHVTYGKTATTFDPNASITRAEIVAMIYRYAGSPSVSGSLGGFVDASSIGAWAKDAVIWATTLGVIHGYTDGRFGPNRTALRSEMAAMLHRYMEMSSVL